MFGAFVVVALAAASLPARVEISSPKTRIWTFEPVKLTVRLTANEAIDVPPVLATSGTPSTEVWVDYGGGFLLYSDDSRERVEDTGITRRLEAGGSFVFTLVLIEGRLGDADAVPFPAPGRYPVKIKLRHGAIVLGESAPITFDVTRPETEDDLRILGRVQADPFLMRAQLGLVDADVLALLQQSPASPYLQWAKRQIAVQKGNRIANGRAPDTDEAFDETGKGSPIAAALFRQLADQLLAAESWGPFDEQRYALAALYMERGGALEEAKQIWRQILELFPGTEAAEEAKDRIDTTPPTLALSASPAGLWPPNHTLQTITMSIQVADDQDPKPRVTLTSIVCDDGCDPARDITGAAFGTDDRQFALRSERRGTGTGRTYRITYSAQDAAGNKATSQAVVIVSHDQGQNRPSGPR